MSYALLGLVSAVVTLPNSALICSKVYQVARFLSHNAIAEVTLMYMFGTLSYAIAEIADMSGVITVLVCGICLAHFNFYNLSITGQISTG
jgi:sodium/hydrogen exchanger-like protein 6/7/sodium/hydrogen exchanger 8